MLIRSLVVSVLVYFAILLVALTALMAVTQLSPVVATTDGVLQVSDGIVDRFFPPQADPENQNGEPPWQSHSLFRFAKALMVVLPIIAAGAAFLFYVALCIIRLSTWLRTNGYELRLFFQRRIEGTLLTMFTFAVILAAVPIVQTTVSENIKLICFLGYISVTWAALAKMRTFLGNTDLFKKA